MGGPVAVGQPPRPPARAYRACLQSLQYLGGLAARYLLPGAPGRAFGDENADANCTSEHVTPRVNMMYSCCRLDGAGEGGQVGLLQRYRDCSITVQPLGSARPVYMIFAHVASLADYQTLCHTSGR
jgi:hypothetical protein